MLFRGELFAPELAPDPAIRAVLSEVAELDTPMVRACDILACALRQSESDVTGVIFRALDRGTSIEDLLGTIEGSRIASGTGPVVPRPRASFSSAAQSALDQFDAAVSRNGAALDGRMHEVLLLFLLLNLDDRERRLLSALSPETAMELLRGRLEAPGERGSGDQSEAGPPPVIPRELAPSEDLTAQAREATMDQSPFDGVAQYEQLFDAVARVLHRREGNHVLLSGERGVGKSTIIAELARRAAVGKIQFLSDGRFVRIDGRYLPPEESRVRLAGILNAIAGRADWIVCMDGLPALLRNDRTGMRALLLSGLNGIRSRLIAPVTPREYEEFFSDDPDLGEFFGRVEVEEPDADVSLKLLAHFALGLGQRFELTIDEEAVRQAVVLSANYILNDQLPAKALKVLKRACEDVDYERGQQSRSRRSVTADDVIRVVAERSSVPEETLRGIAERSDYEKSLGEMIFGQAHAVREVATELGLIKAGMTDPGKPASVMLFLGPTGTGKTEMAKVLARFYSTTKRLKTYTLGNCVEPHSVATIIGVPPGYVGNDQGGRLINELNADPYCVFLLDEADKAHPDVLQPFLNLFDEGWVSDQRGVRAYANKSIFILTTNVGQRMIADLFSEGKSVEEITARMKEALAQIRHGKSERPVFTPEFLARLKRIVVFQPLDRAALGGITRKLVSELQENWQTKRGKQLVVAPELVEHLAEQGFQIDQKSKGREGGRIARKLIADWIEAPLQRAIAENAAEYRGAGTIAVLAPEVTRAEDVNGSDHARVRFELATLSSGGVSR